MKAVSNTTPLRYLIAIEQKHLLGQLFEKVFVPVAVHEELTDSRTPETVRRCVLASVHHGIGKSKGHFHVSVQGMVVARGDKLGETKPMAGRLFGVGTVRPVFSDHFLPVSKVGAEVDQLQCLLLVFR
jgi:hypothetical protein